MLPRGKKGFIIATTTIATISAIFFANNPTITMKSHPRGPRDVTTSRRALIVGGTGATGSKVLDRLLQSKDWSEVTSLGRRKTGLSNSKLNEIVVPDMLDRKKLLSAVKLTGAYDTIFICHGTTRGKAGGADMFKKIEIDLTANVVELAAQNKVERVSLVSAQGANADKSAVDWFHPLLYIQTLGRKEKAVLDRADAFKHISIFRPGMLNRLKGDRFVENVINYFGIGLSVDVLAKAMIRDAETSSSTAGKSTTEPQIYEGNSMITELSKL